MNNYIFKTCVGGIIGAQQRRQELDNSQKFFHSYQLEDAKAFWSYKEKKPYEFWKKKQSREEYVMQNTFERLEWQKSLQK